MTSERVSNDSMRILRVAQTLYPDVKGGGAYHVHAMSRDQAAMGHDVTVLTVRNDPELPHIEERDGYTIVRYGPTTRLLGNDMSAGITEYIRRADNFDLIHAHSHLYFSTNIAALKRRLGEIPLAITNHGLYSQTAPKWVFDRYLRTIGRWTFNQADVVFCYTDVDERRLREFGVTSEIAVVSNGIDTEQFTPEGPESGLLDSDGPNVLFVGRLVDGKRPQDALQAVNKVRNKFPDVTLYLCGKGPLDEKLKAEAGDQLGDGVIFLGHLQYNEMPEVYRSADVLVLPSRTEGVPRTVLEAIASGTPVVCSDLPQMDAIVDDSGELSPLGDTDVLADKIRYLLEENRQPEIESRYQWSRTVNRATERSQQIVDENR